MAPLSVKERNARFQAMSRSEQRIAIAQDALAQLEKGRYNAEHIYCELMELPSGNYAEWGDIAGGRRAKCQVCATGSLLVSAVFLSGKLQATEDWQDSAGSVEVVQELKPYFAESELALIELFYEGKDHLNRNRTLGLHIPGDMRRFAELYYYEVNDDYRRMAEILNSIIDNGGNFDADKLMQSYPGLLKQATDGRG